MMIDIVFDRFDDKMGEFLEKLNMNGQNRMILEEDLDNLVKEFCEVEECSMNLVIASRFIASSEATYVVVLNLIDEVNHKIVSRVSSLKLTLM